MCSHAIPQYSLAVSKYAVMLSISSCTLWKLCYSFAVSKYAVICSPPVVFYLVAMIFMSFEFKPPLSPGGPAAGFYA